MRRIIHSLLVAIQPYLCEVDWTSHIRLKFDLKRVRILSEQATGCATPQKSASGKWADHID